MNTRDASFAGAYFRGYREARSFQLSVCFNRLPLHPAQMMLYTEHGALDALNDSDGDETSKLEDSEGRQQQYMFIWSPRYEVRSATHIVAGRNMVAF